MAAPGRSAVFFDAAIQFCLTIKVLFKVPLRQALGMVASLLKMANLDWAVPDYRTLCRRQKTLAVQVPKSKTSLRQEILDRVALSGHAAIKPQATWGMWHKGFHTFQPPDLRLWFRNRSFWLALHHKRLRK